MTLSNRISHHICIMHRIALHCIFPWRNTTQHQTRTLQPYRRDDSSKASTHLSSGRALKVLSIFVLTAAMSRRSC